MNNRYTTPKYYIGDVIFLGKNDIREVYNIIQTREGVFYNGHAAIKGIPEEEVKGRVERIILEGHHEEA